MSNFPEGMASPAEALATATAQIATVLIREGVTPSVAIDSALMWIVTRMAQQRPDLLATVVREFHDTRSN